MEGHKVEVVVPGTVKKFATGSGKATKEEMIDSLPKHVREYFDALGVKKTTGLADLTDAYFIAKHYKDVKS
jgi:Holliday junction resolvasome RuvABC endonuclease subunit